MSPWSGLLTALPLAGALALPLVGRRWPTLGVGTALVALAATGVAWIELWSNAPARIAPAWQLGDEMLRADGLALLIAAVALVIGATVVLAGFAGLIEPGASTRFLALLLVEIASVVGLALATDLFNLWLWFEAMAIASYALVVVDRGERDALEAGVKYLIQGAAGSTLALIGVALVLADTGTLRLDDLRANVTPTPPLLAAGALMLIGFGVKAGLAPMHAWLPDAYGQAPDGASALLSGLVSKLGLVAVLRVLVALAGVSPSWPVLLLGLGALTVAVGNLLALGQTRIKRLLAYSSLAQVGYVGLGLGIGLRTAEPQAFQGGFFLLVAHGLASAGAFLTVAALSRGLVPADRAGDRLTIAELRGTARLYPGPALALTISVLGLAGLPPLAGFVAKWQILLAGVTTGDPLSIGVVVFAALNSVLSLSYYAPIVTTLYRDRPSPLVMAGRPLAVATLAGPALLVVGTVVLGIWPSLAGGLTEPAATAVLRALGGQS